MDYLIRLFRFGDRWPTLLLAGTGKFKGGEARCSELGHVSCSMAPRACVISVPLVIRTGPVIEPVRLSVQWFNRYEAVELPVR
jgi:hypothetical protein